jgi:hypothetical protein
MVLSAPLPTIINDQSECDVMKLRSCLTETIYEKTNLTIKYNTMMKEFCIHNKIGYLDITYDILDTNTGILSHKFMNKNLDDHHLDNIAIASVLKHKLNKHGFK